MLENITEMVKQYAGDAIINNPAVPNEKNDQVIEAASHSIMDTIKGKLSGGSIADAQQMLSAEGSQGLVNELTTAFSSKAGALGINADTASSIATSLFPTLINKVKDMIGGGNFNIGDMLGGLTGGSGDGKSSGGLGDIAGKFGL